MRFVTFRHAGVARAGVLVGDADDPQDRVFDLSAPVMRDALGGLQPDIACLLAAGLEPVAAAIASHGLRAEAALALDEVQLLAPLPAPRRIYALAFNYRDAVRERGMDEPAEPVLFMKQPATVIGPHEPVVLPAGVGGVTYESELAVFIGRAGQDIDAADAMSHVAGACVFNDVSASELIRKDKGFERGKNLPTFGPFGPFLATLDELGDLHALDVRFERNGERLQSGTTADLIFDIPALVCHLSRGNRLEPGDVIATGTPAGVAAMRSPPAWLRPGDTMRASVAGLGTLTNPVIEQGVFNG
jgi:2,4-diketo-3-deoxy-L-fuconate hydrolase